MPKFKNYGSPTSIIKIAQLIIARLDGREIKRKFQYYKSLVQKGIGGFIVFGGNLKEVSRAIKRLQDIAEIPLFIASDLEQGLGQQIKGGTLFPPAMAIGEAIKPDNRDDIRLLRKTISIIAQEAKAAGINTIFSPVLDVNTNPENPIICTRAFSDNPKKVAWFGNEFINGFQRYGLIACAKHFPGHGDTIKDSHIELPVVKADFKRLRSVELYPFTQAVKAGVKMIMVGHLKVSVIDGKFPSSLSQKTIKGLLRKKMKFRGLVITDAINMKAIKLQEEKACLTALNAGANVILHPSKPEKVIDYLASRWEEVEQRIEESYQRVLKAKKEIGKIQDSRFPGLDRRSGAGKIHDIGKKSSWETARELTQKSIKIVQKQKISKLLEEMNPLIFIIDDDNNKSGKPFINTLKKRYKKLKTFYVDNKSSSSVFKKISELQTHNSELIIAVFSKVSAMKGRSGLSRKLKTLLERAVKGSRYSVIAGFCCPYVLSNLKADVVIKAYPDASGLAQKVAGKVLCDP